MKNKKGEGNMLVTIIILAMLLFIGFAFVTSTANTKASITEKVNVVNEQDLLSECYVGGTVNETNPACNITLANAPTGWKLTEPQCAVGSVVVTNSTGGLVLEEGTDYELFAQQGLIQFLNTSDTADLAGNITLTDYNYCPDGYLKSSGDRGLAGLIPTMMILVLLVIAAGVAYAIFRKR